MACVDATGLLVQKRVLRTSVISFPKSDHTIRMLSNLSETFWKQYFFTVLFKVQVLRSPIDLTKTNIVLRYCEFVNKSCKC